MQVTGKYILILIAILTVMGHSVFPHLHLPDNTKATSGHQHHPDTHHGNGHHHEQEDNSTQKLPLNIFSFAQIDEDFAPGVQLNPSFEQPVVFIYSNGYVAIVEAPQKLIPSKNGCYTEYPPPIVLLTGLPARAPPIV